MNELLRADVEGAFQNASKAPSRRSILPFITIAVPALDEAGYIEECIESLVAQWPADACEILVLDGGSTDGTQALVEALALRHPHVRLVANPRRIQSAAMNLAARIASPRASVMVRADAHALYPQGFVRRCVGELLRTGATSVVVPMRTVAEPRHAMQRAIAAAQSSRFGNGGAAHRVASASCFVDHGHHAAFDLAFFRSIGGYDESFTHNEDAEFDHRAALAGGRVWMAAEAPVIYFPRRSIPALARQYFKHGAGRARTLSKHRLRPRPRQLAPVATLGALVGGVAMAPFAPGLAALVLAYPLLCLVWAMTLAARHRDGWMLAAAPALVAMHLAWAVGFLDSLFKTQANRRQDAQRAPHPVRN